MAREQLSAGSDDLPGRAPIRPEAGRL